MVTGARRAHVEAVSRENRRAVVKRPTLFLYKGAVAANRNWTLTLRREGRGKMHGVGAGEDVR